MESLPGQSFGIPGCELVAENVQLRFESDWRIHRQDLLTSRSSAIRLRKWLDAVCGGIGAPRGESWRSGPGRVFPRPTSMPCSGHRCEGAVIGAGQLTDVEK